MRTKGGTSRGPAQKILILVRRKGGREECDINSMVIKKFNCLELAQKIHASRN